ncbi:MAG: succinate dehydrogenase cytochrome b subunit [Acidimicrobiia bacterium]
MVATTERRRLPWPVEFYRSAVGKKWIMAITGIIIIGFLIAHLAGNLKLFLPDVNGVPDLDIYGEALRSLFSPILPDHVFLWIMRVGLILAFVFHILAAYSLTIMNRRARPTDYSGPRTYLAANYASRTMRWSGVIVLLYVLFHLADLSWGLAPAAPEVWERGHVYANMIATFSRPLVSLFYIVANLALGLHLFHGAWSMFQSLGINNPRYNRWRRYFAWALAGVITIGNISMPIAILLGFGRN